VLQSLVVSLDALLSAWIPPKTISMEKKRQTIDYWVLGAQEDGSG
jgi:hypothetical protein